MGAPPSRAPIFPKSPQSLQLTQLGVILESLHHVVRDVLPQQTGSSKDIAPSLVSPRDAIVLALVLLSVSLIGRHEQRPVAMAEHAHCVGLVEASDWPVLDVDHAVLVGGVQPGFGPVLVPQRVDL